jgi:hypothetical protein
LEYSWARYGFAAKVRDILQVEDLTRLRGEDFGVVDLITRESDQSSELHKRFYAGFGGRLGVAYRLFVGEIARLVFPNTEVLYQVVPTFRVQFPDNLAVGEFHTDAEYHHLDGTLNVWVPLTRVFGSNSVWVERGLGLGDHQPWVLSRGQCLVFDGVNWSHGNVRNHTGVSRVSFDFRLIPAASYRDTGARTVSAGRELRLGDYYAELDPISR